MPGPRGTSKSELIIASTLEGVPPLMTRAEVAGLLRCGRDQVSALINSGELLAVQRRIRKGSPILVPRESLRTYLERAAR